MTNLDLDIRRDAALLAAKTGRLDLAEFFLDGIEPPSFADSEQSFGVDELKYPARQIIKHAGLNSWLGRAFAPGRAPRSQLMGLFQTKLETIGRLLGDAYATRPPHVDPVQTFRTILDFLQYAEGERPHDSDRWRLDRIMDEAVGTMADMAGTFGPKTFARFNETMDARLASSPGRLGRSSVRRAFAMAAYRYEYDAEVAKRRLAYKPGLERTPGEQLQEAAETATTLARFGLESLARAALVEMHADGLGYARPARKDAQYTVWRDLLVRANAEDPAGRPERLRFFGRLLAGLSNTEGDNAAGRLAATLIDEGAQAGSSWARAAVDLIDDCAISDWSTIVRALTTGVVKRNPGLAAVASIVFGRIGLAFSTGRDISVYGQLVALAPTEQLDFLLRHAVSCLEADSPPESRILFLEELVAAGKDRGRVHGTEALARWRAELPSPQSGNSPEDPFFLVRSLEEIGPLLEKIGNGSGAYGAIRAFERLVPGARYDSAKTLFESEEILQKSDSALEVIAQAAISAVCPEDALRYLIQLADVAKNGSWGDGWRGNAKQRYHRLNVALRGEPARQAAFDAFIDDLTNRRKSIEYVLPDLGSVLDLLSPRLSWAETWDHMRAHLTEFREYQIGYEIQSNQEDIATDEHTLADILFRAIETTGVELTTMARTAAIELADAPNGAAVVNSLIVRLWQAGGYMALEACQIAWECKENVAVRDGVASILHKMADSEDLAVRRISFSLGDLWGQSLEIKRRELPVIYSLEIPPDPEAEKFEPPSGMTTSSSGLYTEDIYAWTWVLGDALRLTARASGLPLGNLRRRVGQLMVRMGGTNAFGPPAIQRQQSRLRQLEIHTFYRKLPNSAALQSMREAVGELTLADAIDPGAIPYILRHAGAFSSRIPTLPPVHRPIGVRAPKVPNDYRSEEIDEWLSKSETDALEPVVEGHIVLAATALHERRRFREGWLVEQYYGPQTDRPGKSLFGQLQQLPDVVIGDQTIVRYDGCAPGAVVYPQYTLADSVGLFQIMFCPRVAQELGWRSDSRNLFAYRDQNEDVVVRTLYWRDGGERSKEWDDATRRYGYILLVRADQAKRVQPYLSCAMTSRAWRTVQRDKQ